MIRCRNITYRGYGIVGTTTGGKCEIWTHGTLLFFGFQDRCNKPDSANFPCGIPSRTRTYRNWILSPVCLPVSSWGYMALGARLELATLWLTARCSTVELPKNKWRMVQDLNLWLFCNNISLAKKLNKPLWQPSMVTGEKTGYRRSLITATSLYRPPWLRPIVDLPCGEYWGRTNIFYFVHSEPSNFWSRTSMLNLIVLYL